MSVLTETKPTNVEIQNSISVKFGAHPLGQLAAITPDNIKIDTTLLGNDKYEIKYDFAQEYLRGNEPLLTATIKNSDGQLTLIDLDANVGDNVCNIDVIKFTGINKFQEFAYRGNCEINTLIIEGGRIFGESAFSTHIAEIHLNLEDEPGIDFDAFGYGHGIVNINSSNETIAKTTIENALNDTRVFNSDIQFKINSKPVTISGSYPFFKAEISNVRGHQPNRDSDRTDFIID